MLVAKIWYLQFYNTLINKLRLSMWQPKVVKTNMNTIGGHCHKLTLWFWVTESLFEKLEWIITVLFWGFLRFIESIPWCNLLEEGEGSASCGFLRNRFRSLKTPRRCLNRDANYRFQGRYVLGSRWSRKRRMKAWNGVSYLHSFSAWHSSPSPMMLGLKRSQSWRKLWRSLRLGMRQSKKPNYSMSLSFCIATVFTEVRAREHILPCCRIRNTSSLPTKIPLKFFP